MIKKNSISLRRFIPVNIRRFSIFAGCNVYIQFYFLNINNSSQLFAHESICKNGRDVSYFNVEKKQQQMNLRQSTHDEMDSHLEIIDLLNELNVIAAKMVQ